MRSFDVVIVGGGPAGEEAAGRIARRGLGVALVEDRLVGGECAHWACMPSKALLRPYEALAAARYVAGAREAATGGLDVPGVLRRRDEIIGLDGAGHAPSDDKVMPWVRENGIVLVRGHGRLAGERRVVVGDEELEARRAVILAAGTLPLVPPIEGLDGIDAAWTNREATTTSEIPRRLLLMGGGPVGVELAQAFQSLGSRVTLIEGERRVIPLEEEFASADVADGLRRHGVDLRFGQRVAKVAQSGGTVTVTTDGGSTAEGDVLLVALGRRPATEDLGMDTVGLTPGESVPVDADMRVAGVPWMYAISDITGRTQHTHMGKYQARIAADSILGHDVSMPHGADGSQSPRVLFTDPQVAAVGHTTATAAAAGLEFDAYDTATAGNDGGSVYSPDAPGTARFIVDRERRVLIGCTITGPEVADFLHAATIAVVGELPLERLRHAVPPFPTRSEIWLSLLEQAGV